MPKCGRNGQKESTSRVPSGEEEKHGIVKVSLLLSVGVIVCPGPAYCRWESPLWNCLSGSKDYQPHRSGGNLGLGLIVNVLAYCLMIGGQPTQHRCLPGKVWTCTSITSVGVA
eukprot:244846-Amphidinium_carterae.1